MNFYIKVKKYILSYNNNKDILISLTSALGILWTKPLFNYMYHMHIPTKIVRPTASNCLKSFKNILIVKKNHSPYITLLSLVTYNIQVLDHLIVAVK